MPPFFAGLALLAGCHWAPWNPFEATAGPEIFPLEEGLWWDYRYVTGVCTECSTHYRVEGTARITDGKEEGPILHATLYDAAGTDLGTSQTVLFLNAEGLFEYGTPNPAGWEEPIPAPLLRFNLHPGKDWSAVCYVPGGISGEIFVEVEDIVSVDTYADTFEAWQIYRYLTPTFDPATETRVWYAKDVGMVRMEAPEVTLVLSDWGGP